MRVIFSLLTGTLFFLASGASFASDSDPKEVISQASSVAQAWLGPLDRKEYASAYDTAGVLLHEKITLDHWTGALNAIRANFGAVLSRQPAGHDYYPQGFQSKEGEFVQLDYTTKFKELDLIYTESVILHREGGSWVVEGYTLVPPPATPEQLASQPYVESDEPQESTMKAAPTKQVQITRKGGANAPIPPTSIDGSSSDALPK